jgi:hypothetical protein
MLNFDQTNQDHILLVVGILKYISEDKCVKCFSVKGKGKFNMSGFSRKIENDDSTHTIVTKTGESRNNGKEFSLTFNDKNKIFTVNNDSFLCNNRVDLETAFFKIEPTKLLPVGLAEQVWKEVFTKTDKAMKIPLLPVLPENILTPDVCKDIEFKSQNLVTSVITSTLKWAYDNSASIIEAAKNNNCQFRYLITSDLAKQNLKAFKEQVEDAGVNDIGS